jgi:cold-inducible RNA-binding protein
MSPARLFVGNLNYETSEASLGTLFRQHGLVASVSLITDRSSGRSKGFGFVEMGTLEQARAAKAALDGAQLDGRAIKVDMAKERLHAPRPGGGYRGGNRRW